MLFRGVRDFETGEYPNGGYYHMSMACNHCENPACVAACTTGAMFVSEDGTVQHDDALCDGCQNCVMACPYGQPQYIEEKNVVHKCDSCKVLRDMGEQPACVAACLMRCLEFGDLDELKAKHQGEDLVQELACLPEAITKPSILIRPRAAAKEADFAEILI